MSIMELFWPKEMKEAVKRLQAEGLLNEEAVQTMNYKTKSSFVVLSIVSLLFVLIGSSGVQLFGIALFILQPFCVKFDTSGIYRAQMKAYLIGEKVEAICIFSNEGLYGMQTIRYRLVADHAVLGTITMGGKPKLHVNEFPKKDERFFMYRPANGKRGMLDHEYLKKKYSLTKAIL